MFSWASWCCWYSKTRNFCTTSSQDLIYSKKNEGNLKKLPKSAKNWPHMSNFPQLFGQNLTIWWSRHVVLMSMKLTMPKKRGFCNVFWPLGHLLSQKHTWGLSGHLLFFFHMDEPKNIFGFFFSEKIHIWRRKKHKKLDGHLIMIYQNIY